MESQPRCLPPFRLYRSTNAQPDAASTPPSLKSPRNNASTPTEKRLSLPWRSNSSRRSSTTEQSKNELVENIITQASAELKFPNPFLYEFLSRPISPVGPLLPPQIGNNKGKATLVIDLDETLVHSSFEKVEKYSFIISVTIGPANHSVYVAKRPGVEEFLASLAPFYELIIFTASLAKYADPLLDEVDPDRKCAGRLFRESCVIWDGHYVKDLSLLGRDLKTTIILDNSPVSYAFHPQNGIPIESWFNDSSDTKLLDLIPVLTKISDVMDLPSAMKASL